MPRQVTALLWLNIYSSAESSFITFNHYSLGYPRGLIIVQKRTPPLQKKIIFSLFGVPSFSSFGCWCHLNSAFPLIFLFFLSPFFSFFVPFLLFLPKWIRPTSSHPMGRNYIIYAPYLCVYLLIDRGINLAPSCLHQKLWWPPSTGARAGTPPSRTSSGHALRSLR